MEVSRHPNQRYDLSERTNHISSTTGVQPQNVIHVTIRPSRNIRCTDSRTTINSLQRSHVISSTQYQKSNHSSDLSAPDNRSDFIMRNAWSDKNGCVNECPRKRNTKKTQLCFGKYGGGCSYLVLALLATLLVSIVITAGLVGTLINNKTTTSITSTVTSTMSEIETTEGPTTELTTITIGTLTTTNETVYGIWNTTVGGDSTPSSAGTGIGNYYPGEIPSNAFDNQTTTKYTNFGICTLASANSLVCGLSTGLYLTPQRGSSLLLNLQFCTGNDLQNRDPFTITIEGSNQAPSLLTLGSSWTLIYNGSTGLQPITNRYTCGAIQSVPNNSIWYSSYRILVTSKRDVDVATQYSEVKLIGYQ